jgi:hypothetical protein
VQPLAQAVQELTVTNDEEYQAADALLGSVRGARRQWASMFKPVHEPLKLAKANADKLNRDIDGPMETMETAIKRVMADYSLEKERRIAEQKRLADEEAERLRKKLEEATNKELAAKTAPMRERLRVARETLETQVVEQAEETEETLERPVEAEHSRTRKVRKWRLVDLEAYAKVTRNYVILDTAAVTRDLRSGLITLDDIAGWPGFEVYEDVVIASR